MYDVSITNNYLWQLTVYLPEPTPPPEGGYLASMSVAPRGGKVQLKNWGSATIEVPGMGRIAFVDLGDRKLDGYTNPTLPWTQQTWGGLVRYRGLDAYFRYDGGGKVDLVVDHVGSISLHFAQGGMIINLPDMTLT